MSVNARAASLRNKNRIGDFQNQGDCKSLAELKTKKSGQ
jgi:hypothetical protein